MDYASVLNKSVYPQTRVISCYTYSAIETEPTLTSESQCKYQHY